MQRVAQLDHPEVREVVASHHCVVRFRQRRPVAERGVVAVAEALVAALEHADVSRWPPAWAVSDRHTDLWAVNGSLAFPLERLAPALGQRRRQHRGNLLGIVVGDSGAQPLQRWAEQPGQWQLHRYVLLSQPGRRIQQRGHLGVRPCFQHTSAAARACWCRNALASSASDGPRRTPQQYLTLRPLPHGQRSLRPCWAMTSASWGACFLPRRLRPSRTDQAELTPM